MGLTYPPEWKFDDEPDGTAVPAALRGEVYTLIEKIARGSEHEGWVIEQFKSRFGDANSSSSVSWAYSDLSTAMDAMKTSAEFAEAFWLGVEDAREKGCMAPTLAQVNKLYAKHGFPFLIEPPQLRRTDQASPALATPASVKPSTDRPLGPPSGTTDSPATAPDRPAKRPQSPSISPPALTTLAALALPEPFATPRLVASSGKRTCFVAQPFEEPFQTRFAEDVEPAILAAGLEAYKVDNDEGADWLVDDIHEGIRHASVVLVDITLEKPNVWYELGYSQSLRKLLVMICNTTERGAGKAYPFDIAGRKVIQYTTGTRSAHDKLQKDITARINALLDREEKAKTEQIPRTGTLPASPSTVAAAGGSLEPLALAMFASVLASASVPGEFATVSGVADSMRAKGYKQEGVAVGTRLLVRRGLIRTGSEQDDFGNNYPVLHLTQAGEDFAVENHELIETRHSPKPQKAPTQAPPSADDDIPF